MPKIKHTAPDIGREKNQRSVDYPLYLGRGIVPLLYQPTWVEADGWRRFVDNQPVAVDCRDTQINNLLALDWKIEPRDSTQRDELSDEIKYYERFLTYTGEFDYSEIIEWIGKDLLDLPFGAAAEIGRQNDDPNGKVLWIQLLDGGTLFPFPNKFWPVYQYAPGTGIEPIYFPYYAINRVYMSPRTEIRRNGWGIAPPEKIFMAMEMLSRGDKYYANLLLDTPDAGILDLMDMSKESAEDWIKAWREMLTGIDPYKVPVLYEHNSQTKWIPFTKNPMEIAFNEAIGKYESLVAAGYGMTLSDIGISHGGGGNSLAGAIRDERKTKRNGFARIKRKISYWFDRILPAELRFRFVDLDEELSVAMGRARLANATAMGMYVDKHIFSESEARQQSIADGLVTITVPESLPPELQKNVDNKNNAANNVAGKSAERPSMLGRPVTPGQGGWGEVAARSLSDSPELDNSILKSAFTITIADILTFLGENSSVLEADLDGWRNQFDSSLFQGEGEIPPGHLQNSVDKIKSLFSVPENEQEKFVVDTVSKSIVSGIVDYVIGLSQMEEADDLTVFSYFDTIGLEYIRNSIYNAFSKITPPNSDIIDVKELENVTP